MLDFRTLKSNSEIKFKYFSGKLHTSFLKTALLQREPFLTMFFYYQQGQFYKARKQLAYFSHVTGKNVMPYTLLVTGI